MMSATTLEEANAELTLRMRQQELAAAFATFSLGTDALSAVLHEACRTAAQGMGCDLAKVVEYLPDEGCFIIRAGVGWLPGTVGAARLDVGPASPAGYAFQTGQPVLANHLGEETRFRTPDLLVQHGVRRAFNVPVSTPEWRFGVLEVDGTDNRRFTVSDTAFLETLAAMLALAIGKQRRTDELQLSRAFSQGVMDASPDCIKLMSADGRLVFVNARGLEMHEVASAEHILGREFASTWPKAERPAIRDAISRASHGEVTQFEGYCPISSGKPRWWDLRFAPFGSTEGGPAQVLGISRDISKRCTAEAELRRLAETLELRVEERARELLRSEAQRRAYFAASPEYLVLTRLTPGGRVVIADINPATEAQYGLRREDVVGREPAGLVDQVTAAGLVTHTKACIAKAGPVQFETAGTAVGQGLILSVVAVPVDVPDEDGKLVLFCARDITEQRGAEEGLRQAQKMEAIGQLTGGLAHDFNNLLTGVTGSLELLRTRIVQGRIDELDRYVAAAQADAKRASALTHRLLAFARHQKLEPGPVAGNRLVSGMVELVSRTVGSSVGLSVDLAQDLWTTLCDPNQLESALLNLCINARDAMPDGGLVTITTANVVMGPSLASLTDLPDGEYITISVTDTGTGMPAEVAARAFDPFFTTKKLGAGTGLGLSMTYGFARQSGGQVRIHSVENQGTTVSIYLPRHLEEAAAEPQQIDLSTAPHAIEGETVLVVEDESTLRLLLAEVLGDLGYQTLSAADGASGLELLKSDTRIDLLVTDLGLPGGMNGCQMADAARRVRPDLKVLFITGYADGTGPDNTTLGPGVQVMTKPFALETLACRIREILTPAPARG